MNCVLNHSRLSELEIFIQVIKSGNFSSAARQLHMDPSSISKLIVRLEKRLGARLMHRTTRKVVLTYEGEHFYHSVTRIIEDIKEAEDSVLSHHSPKGNVRITCSVPFALHQLIPAISELSSHYPNINITLLTTDNVVDLIAERCDIAVRIGNLADSSLKVRKLAESKMLLIASPHYIKHHGIPQNPSQLEKHKCLNFYGHPELNAWPFKEESKLSIHEANGSFSADNGESIAQLALSGYGIARLSAFMVRENIKQGRLVPLLEKYNTDQWQPIYLIHSGNSAARVICVIDYIFKKLGNTRFL